MDKLPKNAIAAEPALLRPGGHHDTAVHQNQVEKAGLGQRLLILQ